MLKILWNFQFNLLLLLEFKRRTLLVWNQDSNHFPSWRGLQCVFLKMDSWGVNIFTVVFYHLKTATVKKYFLCLNSGWSEKCAKFRGKSVQNSGKKCAKVQNHKHFVKKMNQYLAQLEFYQKNCVKYFYIFSKNIYCAI